MTRHEFEFGFDDASTLASEPVHVEGGDALEDTAVVGAEVPPDFFDTTFALACRDYYELLCVPRDLSLSPDQVRAAAHRLNQVLAVERQSPRLQGAAAFYLGLVQAAYETLAEPSRRLGYDLSGDGQVDMECDHEITVDDEEAEEEEKLPESRSSGSYVNRLQEQYLLLTQREARPTTDLALRMDAASLFSPQRNPPQHGSGLEPMDLALRKSATVSVPGLRRSVESTLSSVRDFFADPEWPQAKSSLHLRDPTLTITGSMHGLLDGPFKVAPLLLDRYQPPGPCIHGPRRMQQLLASRFLPVLNANLRQEFFWRTRPHARAVPDLVVEQELELLPQPSTTTRVGYSIELPGSDEPVKVEVSTQKLLAHRSGLSSNLGLAVHRRVGPGTAFVVADAGDSSLWSPKGWRQLLKFSKTSWGSARAADIFSNPPTVEVGYAFGRHDLGMQSGQAFTKPSERGLAALDCDVDENKPGSWTVSTGLTPGTAATYLRYGRDFFSSFTSRHSTRRNKTGLRAEVELAGTTQHSFFVAFRALKRIGRFSKAGLEVSLSPSNFHLSLYWSRLGQRVSLPILACTHHNGSSSSSRLATKLLFWTTVFPFAALAAWDLYRQRQRTRQQKSPSDKSHASEKTMTPGEKKIKDKEKTQEVQIARSRAEADSLTVILATGIDPYQKAQRQHGGLAILSAKYGVPDAPPEEVADVTIAVAALVEYYDDGTGKGKKKRGRLVIPAGLRKSRLLGFWDPAPGKTKVLRVRYSWEGEEKEVEVRGGEELRLP
jgi:DnaJ family protein C protein 11